MKITGQIYLREEGAVTSTGANVKLRGLWRGGKLAKLTKELMNYDALHGYKVCRRLDCSTILLFQTRLRVILEHEHYLVVMRDGWQARAVQVYYTICNYLADSFPALFGRFKDRLLE